MASAQHGCTTDEFFETLQEFNIPDEGMNSDLKGFDGEEDAGELDTLRREPAFFFLLMRRTKGYNFEPSILLRRRKLPKHVELVGRPSNVSVDGLQWSTEDSDMEVPSFRQSVGPSRVLPEEASAVDFFLLFVDNRILNNIVRETNSMLSRIYKLKVKILLHGQK